MHFTLLAFCVAGFSSIAWAYPADLSSPSLVRRDCSSEIAAFNLARRAKRGLDVKRSIYWGLQNLTCILAPESLRENYVANPIVRSDVTEGQIGISLTLDIGILDVTTCQPLPNTMVEIWSPNAVGEYGATFLRGALNSADNGIAEFQTIFPGFTSEGANHINLLVHTSSSVSSPVAHVGQVFFTDPWTTIIGMTSPYNQNTHTRVTNINDSAYAAASKAGYYPVVEYVLLLLRGGQY
ncbi:Intradiol ring-cleavage dioxygenase [Crucibulum laeve]|uniref:Intradiol ring-cleavage dioxygenase n=1 Tax=Crucibulum laeve TaxID=68775 RepID=A0A5C3M8W0_9AGAR|nr:Intradiol ring-cleavage dioxygenase [Crucibulum laeve]